MRISSSTIFSNATTAMSQENALIAKTQQQISTGNSLTSASDNPTAAAEAVNLNQQITQLDNFTQSRLGLNTTLSQMGTVLSQVTNSLQAVLQDLTSANSGAKSPSDLKALAQDLQANYTTLQTYSNTQDANGNYVFSGYQVGTQPFALGNFLSVSAAPGSNPSATMALTSPMASALPGAATLTLTSQGYQLTGLPTGTQTSVTTTTTSTGQSQLKVTVNGNSFSLNITGTPAVGDSFTLTPQAAQYQGDTGSRDIQVSNGQYVGSTLSGPDVFGSITTGNGTFVTGAAASNIGSGIINQGSITNRAALTGDHYQITFAGGSAQITGDSNNQGKATVVQNSTTGTPSNNNAYQILFQVSASGTSYSTVDMSTGVSTPGGPLTAGNSNTLTLPNGVSFSLTGMPASGDSFTYNPGNATTYTVTDLDKPNSPPVLANQSFGSGNSIQFDGLSFTIAGNPSAGDKFTVSPSGTTDVFSAIQSAILALNQGNTGATASAALSNALNSAQAVMNQAISQVDSQQAVIAGRQNLLTALDSSSAQNKINLQAQLGSLTNTDYTAAISQLQQEMMALQASQKAFAQIEGMSLFTYIQ